MITINKVAKMRKALFQEAGETFGLLPISSDRSLQKFLMAHSALLNVSGPIIRFVTPKIIHNQFVGKHREVEFNIVDYGDPTSTVMKQHTLVLWSAANIEHNFLLGYSRPMKRALPRKLRGRVISKISKAVVTRHDVVHRSFFQFGEQSVPAIAESTLKRYGEAMLPQHIIKERLPSIFDIHNVFLEKVEHIWIYAESLNATHRRLRFDPDDYAPSDIQEVIQRGKMMIDIQKS